MGDLTFPNLYAFVAVLLALAAVVVSLDKGFEVVQKWRGVKERKEKDRAIEDRFLAIETRMTACEDRLKKGDQQFESVSEDSRQTLMVLNAMLMHFISGNDHDKLKSVKQELDDYMASRR